MSPFSATAGIFLMGLQIPNSRTRDSNIRYREQTSPRGQGVGRRRTSSCSIYLIRRSTTSGASRSQASGWRMARSARAKPGEARGLPGGRGTWCGSLQRGPIVRGGQRVCGCICGRRLDAKGGNGGCRPGRPGRPRRASTILLINQKCIDLHTNNPIEYETVTIHFGSRHVFVDSPGAEYHDRSLEVYGHPH